MTDCLSHTSTPKSSSFFLTATSYLNFYIHGNFRWKVYFGKAWEHLSGEIIGQTQVSYCRTRESEMLSFNHPLDVHFAVAGLQVLICLSFDSLHSTTPC